MRTRFRSALVLVLALAATTLAVALPGTAEAATAAKWGYAMDDNPFATTNYTPPLSIERQSNGRRATIHHNGVGSYTVTFPGLAAGNTGVVQVTQAGGPGTCQTSGWRNSSGNVLVGVLCFAPGGARADAMFFAMYAVGAGTRGPQGRRCAGTRTGRRGCPSRRPRA